MAKAQSYQEQKVFAKRQCLRFGLDGEGCNEYGIDDEEDDEEDENAEQVTEAKQEFSRLAKMVSAMEQHTFVAMGSVCWGPRNRKRY